MLFRSDASGADQLDDVTFQLLADANILGGGLQRQDVLERDAGGLAVPAREVTRTAESVSCGVRDAS